MNKETVEQLTATSERLASAAEALNRVLDRLDAQQESLNAKVDRIVAAVEEQRSDATRNDDAASSVTALQSRVVELEKTNQELKAQ
jgi:predicted RNase H-like nuclease (RuvC/YqgF family)